MTLELKVPPPLQALVCGLAMVFLAQVAPLARLPLGTTAASALAAVVAFAGVAIALLGVMAFRRAKTTVDPRYPERTATLVTTGIYRFTRNPMYLGMLTCLVALALYLRSVSPWIVPPLFVLCMNRLQIEPEERVMARRFSEAFSIYRGRVRRWL